MRMVGEFGHGLDALQWLKGAKAQDESVGIFSIPELGVVLRLPTDAVRQGVNVMDEIFVDGANVRFANGTSVRMAGAANGRQNE